MNVCRRWRWRWVACLGIVAAIACEKAEKTADKGRDSTANKAGMGKLPVVFTGGPCTTTSAATDCKGALNTLDNGWSGPATAPDIKDTTVERIYALVSNFPWGSRATVRRKPKTTGKKIWVTLESIEDANSVNAGTVSHPVVIARMTLDPKSDNDEEATYNVNKGYQYFVIVSPDTWDGAPADDLSRWDVVAIKMVSGNPRGTIVKSGVKYGPCKLSGGYDPQQPDPFAYFSNCPAAHLASLSLLTLAQSVSRLDQTKKNLLSDSLSTDLRKALTAAMDGTDPIWITCALGCCTVTDDDKSIKDEKSTR